MTRAAGERYCSQHHQPRSECRPEDRHTQPLRCGDGLMAAVAAKGDAIGLSTVNDALEMALEAWVQAPLRPAAEQALADRRIRRLPPELDGDEPARTEPPGTVAPATPEPLRRARARAQAGAPAAKFRAPGGHA